MEKINGWPKWIKIGIVLSLAWAITGFTTACFLYHKRNVNMLGWALFVLAPIFIGWLGACIRKQVILTKTVIKFKTWASNTSDCDAKTRKQWLTSFMFFHVLFWLIYLFTIYIGPLLDGFSCKLGLTYNATTLEYCALAHKVGGVAELLAYPYELSNMGWHLFCFLLLPFGISIISALTYYNAYKKRGVLFIAGVLLYLILFAAFLFRQIFEYAGHDWSSIGKAPQTMLVGLIITFYLSMYYLMHCFKLFQANKKLKASPTKPFHIMVVVLLTLTLSMEFLNFPKAPSELLGKTYDFFLGSD